MPWLISFFFLGKLTDTLVTRQMFISHNKYHISHHKLKYQYTALHEDEQRLKVAVIGAWQQGWVRGLGWRIVIQAPGRQMEEMFGTLLSFYWGSVNCILSTYTGAQLFIWWQALLGIWKAVRNFPVSLELALDDKMVKYQSPLWFSFKYYCLTIKQSEIQVLQHGWLV